MSVYVETSAAAKLLVEEAESVALAEYLDRLAGEGVRLISSVLTETEMRRIAVREALSQTAVSAILRGLDLVEPDRALFYEAGILPGPQLRSLDALHVATALRTDVGVFIAYDARQSEAAESVGLQTHAPKANSLH